MIQPGEARKMETEFQDEIMDVIRLFGAVAYE